jgi:UDP-2,4-diacetamido-2,4,6-trideoxy-beta-L-altropyranose hydrolase
MKNSEIIKSYVKRRFSVKIISGSLKKDLKQTIDFAGKINADVIITDSYELNEKYLNELKNRTNVLIVTIDDLNELKYYPSDIVLNQNIYATKMRYNCSKGTKLLLGIKYALLRKEFRKYIGMRKPISGSVKKILVTFGGSDLQNLTLKTVKALNTLDGDFEVTLILGRGFKRKKELYKEIGKSKRKFRVKENIEDISKLMFESDVAISAAGSTSYELAFMGLPSIMICQAKNQYRIAEEMCKIGFSINLGPGGDVSTEKINRAFKKLVKNKSLREKMSKVGKGLVDCRGVERVAKTILNEISKSDTIRLRLVEPRDCKLLWKWRNDPITRKYSFSTKYIPYENHREWFKASLKNKNRCILIALQNNIEIGEVRFDINPVNRNAEINICIDTKYRCKGLGKRTLKEACKYAFKNLKINSIISKIKKENKSSIKIFTHAGFVLCGENNNVIVMILNKSKHKPLYTRH